MYIPIFIADGTGPRTGLSPTWASLYDVATKADKSGAAPEIEEVGGGLYRAEFTPGVAPLDVDELVGVVDAGGTIMDAQRTLPVYISAPLVDQVWDETASDHATAGSTGALLNRIGAVEMSVSSPVAADGSMEIYGGDDYDGNRIITITLTDYSGYDLSAATGKFRLLRASRWERETTAADLQADASIAQDSTTVTITIELTAAQTGALQTEPPGDDENYVYQVVATVGTKTATLCEGRATVNKLIGAAS